MANVEIVEGPSFLGKMAAAGVNGGNSTSSLGNAPAPQGVGGGGGMNRPGAGGGTRVGPGSNGAPKIGGDSVITAEEPPIILELQVDAKGVLKGNVSEVMMNKTLKKLKVENGKVTDKKFEFQTIETTEKVSNTTRWVGELTDEKTITLNRLTKGGNAIDGGPVVFHRAK
jgi:hypothetical protein